MGLDKAGGNGCVWEEEASASDSLYKQSIGSESSRRVLMIIADGCRLLRGNCENLVPEMVF